MAHIPVLLEETITGLNLKPGAIYVDGTLGSGGHAAAAFQSQKNVTIIGFDREGDALKRSEKLLTALGAKPILINDSFRNIASQLKEHGFTQVDAILMDIGISSVQLDDSGRGFTFQKDEPLLMTMEDTIIPDVTLTAADLVNTSSESALADIIYAYGEDTFARRIAKAIVEARLIAPIKTTFDLVKVVQSALPARFQKGKTNPATKTFQALRIAVNDELGALRQGIAGAVEMLAPGGRLAIITFHSLEDRIVKNAFREFHTEGIATTITKKPIVPTLSESQSNPRSRSAKLRIIEKK